VTSTAHCMRKNEFATGFFFAAVFIASHCRADSPTNDADSWSSPTNGLQARITLVQGSNVFGTRWLVPHLELRNTRDVANQMEVRCDGHHLKIELVDIEGKSINQGRSQDRSGPVRELNTVILPWDSSIRINLECRNWGVPKDAAAMVSTDSGAWVIEESQKGNVYLRATLTSEKPASPPYWKAWYGKLQTPLLRVDWR